MALFVAVVITSLCCCLCTGYYLHRRSRRLPSVFEGRDRARGLGRGLSPCAHTCQHVAPARVVWARTALYAALTR